jgi:hypothetical protein
MKFVLRQGVKAAGCGNVTGSPAAFALWGVNPGQWYLDSNRETLAAFVNALTHFTLKTAVARQAENP